MSRFLDQWAPSESAIELIKLNGVDDDQITATLRYLRSTELNDIDKIDGYDNWNAFFIMFCIKANKNSNKDAKTEKD